MNLITFLLNLLFLLQPQDSTHSLKVQVSGLKPLKGDLYLSLHSRPEFFNEPDSAQLKRKITVLTEAVTITLPKIPAGRYALAIYHDENMNGVLDTNEKGLPLEGYGFSTKNKTLGKPKFEQAAFDFPQTASVAVQMMYLKKESEAQK